MQGSNVTRRFSDQVHGVARALEQASCCLRAGEHSELARHTEGLAKKMEQVADALATRDVSSLAREVKRLAQQQPALFISGAFTAGLVAARFLKSSARRAPALEQEAEPVAASMERAADDDGFGPAPGGYGPAAAPGTALGGNGIFGPDVSVEAAKAAEALTPEASVDSHPDGAMR